MLVQSFRSWRMRRYFAKKYPQSDFQKYLNQKRLKELQAKLPRRSKARFQEYERSEPSLVGWFAGYALYFAVVGLMVFAGGCF